MYSLKYTNLKAVQDIQKEDSGQLLGRRFLISCLQIFYIFLGYVLSFYLVKIGSSFNAEFLNSLLINGGAATATMIGVSWTLKQKEPKI
jgi:hypothetical protein